MYIKFAKIVLIFIYLVGIAGSIVRMTGSGMGCPDWPKCFGYYIPPSNESELKFKNSHQYEKNQMIIHNDSLFKAKEDFKSNEKFEYNNWSNYEKHNYAIYNVYHTYTEYFNRLIGAVSGLVMLVFVITLFISYREISYTILVLSLIQLLLFAFEAWLGKLTVDSELNSLKLTFHMMGEIVLIINQVIIISLLKNNNIFKNFKMFSFKNSIVLLIFILLIIQIIFGTEVRTMVDSMLKLNIPRTNIPNGFTIQFFIHRTFSLIILFLSLYTYFHLRKHNWQLQNFRYILINIIIIIFTGIIMYYFEFPYFTQPLHLLLTFIIIGLLTNEIILPEEKNLNK